MMLQEIRDMMTRTNRIKRPNPEVLVIISQREPEKIAGSIIKFISVLQYVGFPVYV
jgi:hypothetical protein